MNRQRLAIHLTAILAVFAGALYMAQNCGGRPTTSKLADAATTSRAKSGMYLPSIAAGQETRGTGRFRLASDLAAALRVSMTPGSRSQLLMTQWQGEDILLIDHRDGTIPNPIASLKGTTAYRWDSIGIKSGNNVVTTSTFFRYPAGQQAPELNVENMFVIREAISRTGVKEPFLVPWTRLIQTEETQGQGAMLWRVGDVVIDAGSGLPVLKFAAIGDRMWRLSGPFTNEDLKDGSIFWSKDLVEYYSATAGSNNVVIWRRQDADSMDRVQAVAAANVEIPAAVQQALDREAQRGGAAEVNLGFSLAAKDAGVIRIYPLAERFAGLSDDIGTRGGFGLADSGAASDFQSFVNAPASETGFGLAGDRPQGLPDQYANAQYLGRHNQIQSVSTGWWPFNGKEDRTIQNDYYYVERPGLNGIATRKVVHQDRDGNWVEESATTFATEIEKMQQNSSADRQQAVLAEGRSLDAAATVVHNQVDKDAKAFVDKGLLGHYTDLAVATGSGALGPALKIAAPELTAGGKAAIGFGQTAVTEATKAVPTLLTDPNNAQSVLINAGLSETKTLLNAAAGGAPVGDVASGAFKVGKEALDGDLYGAAREGAGAGVDVTASLIKAGTFGKAIVPADPVTGAAFGAVTEGAKKTIQAGTLIAGLKDAQGQFEAGGDKFREAAQMSNDRQFLASDPLARLMANFRDQQGGAPAGEQSAGGPTVGGPIASTNEGDVGAAPTENNGYGPAEDEEDY